MPVKVLLKLFYPQVPLKDFHRLTPESFEFENVFT